MKGNEATVSRHAARYVRTQRLARGPVVVMSALAVGAALLAPPAYAGQGNLAGRWTSVDHDGSNQTLTIRGSGNRTYAMTLYDDRTSGVCGGTPAKVVGSAVVERNVLHMRGTLICLPGGNPLPGERLDVTFTYSSSSGWLTDSFGIPWRRG